MTPCLNAPCRSLDAYRLELRAERYTTMLAELEAQTAGNDTLAAHHARRITEIDGQLRAIEAAVSGQDSVLGAGA